MIALLFTVLAAEPTVLDDSDFRFCHRNADYRYNPLFCPLLEDLPEDRCVGLREFCAAPEDAPSRGCDAPTAGDGVLGSGPASAPDRASAEWDLSPSSCSSESQTPTASTLLGWVFAFFVALLLGGVAALVLRFLGLRSDTPAAPTVRVLRLDEEEQDFAEAVDDVPDLPSEDLLSAARRALENGGYGEAAVLARGAVLRRLGEKRVLKLHRARTDREYLRQAAEHRAELGTVLDVAEQHRWGQVPLDAPRVQAALAAAARLLAAVLLLLWAGTALGANERYGPEGDVGLERVLANRGLSVSYRLRSLESLSPEDESPDVLVLDLSGIAPTDDAWAAIRLWVEAGHVLWVAGQPVGFPELGERVEVEGPAFLGIGLGDEGLTQPVWPGGPGLGFERGDGWVVAGGANPVSVVQVGEGVVLALADPILFWNGSLVDPRNEAFLGEALLLGQRRGWRMHNPIEVQLATLAAGASDNDPMQSVRNLRLLPFVLQVLVLWGVVVAWRGWPFAPLVDPPSEGRRDFGEHLDALARRYRATGGRRIVASAYAALLLERLRRTGLVLAARRHGYSGAEAEQLANRATELAENPDAPGERSDFECMEDLWKVTRPK